MVALLSVTRVFFYRFLVTASCPLIFWVDFTFLPAAELLSRVSPPVRAVRMRRSDVCTM